MTGMVGAFALIAALGAICVFLSRGFFGKRLGRSAPRRDGPAWGAALMGGFAAVSIVEVLPSLAEFTLALAALVGLACGLRAKVSVLSWPAAILGAVAALCTAFRLWSTASGRGIWVGYAVIAVCMVALYAVGELLRLLDPRALALSLRGRGPSVGIRALGYFAALDLTNFLLGPGGAGILDWARRGIGAVVVWLAVILCPVVLGALDPAFLSLFCAGVSLALLYVSFVGLGSTSFLLTMAYLSASMLAYWITRWIIRGFVGQELMSD